MKTTNQSIQTIKSNLSMMQHLICKDEREKEMAFFEDEEEPDCNLRDKTTSHWDFFERFDTNN